MKLLWDAEKLSQHWSLTFDELELLAKKPNRNHIALAICLKYYQYFGSFPTGPNEVAEIPLQYIVDQLGITIATYHNYDWNDRLARYHRQEILDFLGVRKFSEDDRNRMQEWLTEFVFPNGSSIEESVEYVYEWLHHNKIARPAEKQLGRELSSGNNHFEKELYENLSNSLPLDSKYLVDYCLEGNEETISFSSLKSDPGRISLDSVLKEIEKLDFINQLELPTQLLNSLSSKIINRMRLRVLSERALDMQQKVGR